MYCDPFQKYAHPDAEQQHHGDTEQAEHEQPIHPARTRDGLVKARERTSGIPQKAKVGASFLDPRVSGGGFAAQPELLVQERPQEGLAQAQAGQRPQVAGRPGRGRLRPGDLSHTLRGSDVHSDIPF
jgi:hypothetical protein